MFCLLSHISRDVSHQYFYLTTQLGLNQSVRLCRLNISLIGSHFLPLVFFSVKIRLQLTLQTNGIFLGEMFFTKIIKISL